jgi:hypothetical protein
MPGQYGIRGGENMPDQAWCLWVDVAVGPNKPRRDGTHPANDELGWGLGHGAAPVGVSRARPQFITLYMRGQPRPMNGILVAITVMNCTFASSGRLAM